MGYSFLTKELATLIHGIRWDESMPEEFKGLDFNWIMEDVVDQLHSLMRLEARNRILETLAKEAHRITFEMGHGDTAFWGALEAVEDAG